jgi:3-hydroxyacyl-[acyl-carrier-protein] dehydratase
MSTETRDSIIKETLKHCSPETLAAAVSYQTSRSEAELGKLILGVFERDLPERSVASLSAATDESRIMEDLGMDSFGMISVVMTAEEVLNISIANEELNEVTTLGELKRFLQAKVVAQ